MAVSKAQRLRWAERDNRATPGWCHTDLAVLLLVSALNLTSGCNLWPTKPSPGVSRGEPPELIIQRVTALITQHPTTLTDCPVALHTLPSAVARCLPGLTHLEGFFGQQIAFTEEAGRSELTCLHSTTLFSTEMPWWLPRVITSGLIAQVEQHLSRPLRFSIPWLAQLAVSPCW